MLVDVLLAEALAEVGVHRRQHRLEFPFVDDFDDHHALGAEIGDGFCFVVVDAGAVRLDRFLCGVQESLLVSGGQLVPLALVHENDGRANRHDR